ncbi:type VI secretion system baseplate subunit TssG [Photorhabdus asymbiotica]|uniref:type VI secretion system baseplate subunit TssG n=1 Tax=Photorhabdus asymbiotica TaxID=291112 RepID=UPI003DA6D83D
MKIFAIHADNQIVQVGEKIQTVSSALDIHFWDERAKTPWNFDLFQLLRRIDAQSGAPYSLGRSPLPRYEPLRLGQQPTLCFAPAEIASIEPCLDGTRYQININNFGLFGPNGPLPLHVTEFAWQRQKQHKDHALSAFFNLFQHRLITLFWRAWADAQPCLSFDRSDNRRFDRFFASFIGMEHISSYRLRQERTHHYMAGHLSRYPRNKEGLLCLLRYHFGLPVTLHENQFHWLAIARDEQLQLHNRHSGARLGCAARLGIAVADVQYAFCLELGPLSWSAYQRFLPASRFATSCCDDLQQLCDWVRGYVGLEYAWKLRITLDHQHYQGCSLGSPQSLGQNCWLGLNIHHRDRNDLCFSPDKAA